MSLSRALVPGLAAALAVSSCGGTSDRAAPTGTAAADVDTAAPATTTTTETTAALEPFTEESPTCVPVDRDSIVRFRAPDRVPLVGVVLGNGARGVVLAHQLDNDLCAWIPYGRRLARLGYHVLAFSFRGYAPSGGQAAALAYDADVVGAVETLRRRGARGVVAVGASMGGTAVLSAAPEIDPPLAGVASLSGPAELEELDARAAVRRLHVPVLFLASRSDTEFASDAGRLFRAAAADARILRVFPGAAHGIDMLSGRDGREPRSVLERFLDRRLPTP